MRRVKCQLMLSNASIYALDTYAATVHDADENRLKALYLHVFTKVHCTIIIIIVIHHGAKSLESVAKPCPEGRGEPELENAGDQGS